MSDELLCEIEDKVATITLNAPDRRNALTSSLIADMCTTLDEVEGRHDVGALIITGAAPAFCAGASLGDLADTGKTKSSEAKGQGDNKGQGEGKKERLLSIYEGFLRVARSSLPTLAAVNGPAVGAGMNLALACDVRIAGRSGRFDTKFLKLGLHPGGGHTWMAQNVMGPQATAATVLFGERLSAEAALSAGLVWSVVDDAELLSAARKLAANAAADPALARRTKKTIAATSSAPSLKDAVDIEVDAQVWSMERPEFAQRINAARK